MFGYESLLMPEETLGLPPAPTVRTRSASLTKSLIPVVRPRSLSLTINPYNKLSPSIKNQLGTYPIPSFRNGTDAESSCPVAGFGESKYPGENFNEAINNNTVTEDGQGERDYPWLYDDAARYMECLDEFQWYSDEWQGVHGWIEDHLAKLVDVQDLGHHGEVLIPAGYGTSATGCAWMQSKDLDQNYRMLGVGSGSGEIDVAILRVLLPRHPHVSTTVVEPDLSQINLYRQLMVGSEFAGVAFTFHQQRSSEFIMETIHSNMTYDLIHMVHVLYHIEMVELEATFLHYYSILSPGGIMVITYESDKSSFARIRGALQPFKPGMLPYMSIADVEKVLSKVVPAHERDNIKGHLDVTACLQENPSASGERLWDFITRVVNFRANAPEKAVQRAADMLRQFSWRDEGGRMITNTDTAVIIVKRQYDSSIAKCP